MKTNTKTYLYYLKITAIPMIIFVGLGLLVWSCKKNSLEKERETNVSEIIRNTLNQQSYRDLLLPKVVFINTDSSNNKELSDKIITQISTILADKYLTNDTSRFSDIELKPYFVLPNKPNKNGSYILSEFQLDELKGHLDFLTKHVSLEVEKTKEEIGRDIDRINNWVTIWIGVIGFLGIFIPIVINIDTSRNAERATEKSDSAFIKSEEAINKINAAQSEIKKIDGLEQRIDKAEKNVEQIENKAKNAEDKANEADKKADQAKSKSEALHLVYAIDKLDSIEPENIQYVDRDKWIPLFKKTLLSIKQSLYECRMQHDGDIIKESLIKMVIRLSRISFQKFLQTENTEAINNYLTFVTETMRTNYDQANFEKIILGLETLANNLKAE